MLIAVAFPGRYSTTAAQDATPNASVAFETRFSFIRHLNRASAEDAILAADELHDSVFSRGVGRRAHAVPGRNGGDKCASAVRRLNALGGFQEKVGEGGCSVVVA